MYHYHWWKEHPEHYPALAEHPEYPDLSFEVFLRLISESHPQTRLEMKLDPTIGWHTYQLITFYATDPYEFLKSVEGQPLTAEMVRAALVTERLLVTDHLNQQLYDFLGSVNVPKRRRAFILEQPKLRPPGGDRTAEHKWERYLTPELKQYVRRRERLIFELWPEFDV